MDLSAQTITLRDGRTLGFAEWGDLNGNPVFFFGGSNSARIIRHPDDSILHDLSIHLTTFDRPGMGLSTRQAGRTLLDWAEDVRDFARQKQLERFAIVAASQGGPYGAACAYALLDLLTSVSLVSGVAGLEDAAVMATQNRMIRMQIGMARRVPWLLALQSDLMRPMLKGNRTERLVRGLLGNLPESDKRAMAVPGGIDLLVQDIREGMRQGGRGGADDMRAVVMDWGFQLEDIQAHVFIWQGEDDPNVTLAMARYMAARIPDSTVTLVPGAGHFLMYSHWREILEQVVRRM
ncbi:MAG: alpha/beta hydrolase [Chloroflexi bacterium]|nr:alpha/beta hydrolase [Chloroflexota bacterium]